MGGNPLLRNDPSGLDLFTTSAAILSGGAIIIRGGALINGGPLAGAVIVQTGYDGFCLHAMFQTQMIGRKNKTFLKMPAET